MVVSCLLAGLVFAGCGAAPKARPPHTPDAYERAHALTREPDPLERYAGVRMPTAEFLAFAKRYERLVPYPPGRRGRWLWSDGTPEMHDVDHVPRLVIHDASCAWYRSWIEDYDHGGDMRRARVTGVLADLPRWPVLREDRAYYEWIAEEALLWPSVVRDHIRDRCTPAKAPKWLKREIEEDRRKDDRTA